MLVSITNFWRKLQVVGFLIKESHFGELWAFYFDHLKMWNETNFKFQVILVVLFTSAVLLCPEFQLYNRSFSGRASLSAQTRHCICWGQLVNTSLSVGTSSYWINLLSAWTVLVCTNTLCKCWTILRGPVNRCWRRA